MYPDNMYDQNYLNYCMKEAEKMYPEVYHHVYPHIKKVCDKYDNPHNPSMHPFPKKEVVDKMVDEVYENITKEGMYRSPNGFGYPGYGYPGYGYPGVGGSNILRAFIGALLLRELVDRRRYYPRRPGYYY